MSRKAKVLEAVKAAERLLEVVNQYVDPCDDCGAVMGRPHDLMCDLVPCDCGEQRLMCLLSGGCASIESTLNKANTNFEELSSLIWNTYNEVPPADNVVITGVGGEDDDDDPSCSLCGGPVCPTCGQYHG